MKNISILFFIFIIAIIVLADTGNLPYSINKIYDFPNGDKAGHFILFGLLAFFIIRTLLSSLPSKSRSGVALSVSFTLSLLMALEEFSQKFFTTRTFDLVDLLSGYAGVIIFAFLAVGWKNPRR